MQMTAPLNLWPLFIHQYNRMAQVTAIAPSAATSNNNTNASKRGGIGKHTSKLKKKSIVYVNAITNFHLSGSRRISREWRWQNSFVDKRMLGQHAPDQTKVIVKCVDSLERGGVVTNTHMLNDYISDFSDYV